MYTAVTPAMIGLQWSVSNGKSDYVFNKNSIAQNRPDRVPAPA